MLKNIELVEIVISEDFTVEHIQGRTYVKTECKLPEHMIYDLENISIKTVLTGTKKKTETKKESSMDKLYNCLSDGLTKLINDQETLLNEIKKLKEEK